jgi:carboxypeptidase Q
VRVAERMGRIGLWIGVLGLAACATTPDPARDRARLLAEADDAHAIAASLTTEVGPRFAGTEGDGRAVQWALRKLAGLGFQNVRAEPVVVPRWERGEILVELAGERLDAVALGGSVATPARGLEAEVVAVPTVEALEALPDARVKGRIVFYTGRMQRTRDGAGYEKAVVVRRKGPTTAARKGAVAALIRSIGTDVPGRPHTGTTKYDPDAPKIPAAALAGAAADRLEQAVAKGKARLRIRLTSRDGGEAMSANVIGEIPGATGEIVLLGAHLDSWDITPGANDDAAGVGIVIAAAQRVAKLGTPRRTIRVVLFANEEFGVHGGKAYAAAHADELDRHVAVMEADSGSGAPYRLQAWVDASHWPAVAGLAPSLDLEAGQNGQEGGTDVTPLRKLGVPELIVSQDASRYFDVHHTAGDTAETLDRAGLSRAAGVFAVLTQLACERPEGFGRLPPAP